MRIAVDVDGVLADTMVTFCRILNQRRHTPLPVDAFDRWNAWEVAGITKDEFFRILDQSWFEWSTIPPTEKSLGEKVERLRQFGKVEIVTGRSVETVPQAHSWLQQYKIRYDAFVRTESTKAKARLSYDVFIDDSAELMSLVASRLDGYGVLYSRPWNKTARDMPRIYRVESWDDIPAVMRRMNFRKT